MQSRTAICASPAFSWINLANPKRVYLADDDPALPPKQLAARLKERAKIARRKERQVTGEAPLVGGRPLQGDSPKPDTLQRRKRKAAKEAAAGLIDLGLPDFDVVGGVEAAATAAMEAAAEKTRADNAAAMQAASEQAAAEAATEAATEAAIEAAVEQAAAEAAAAEIEEAIGEAAACMAAERAAAIDEVVDGMVAAEEKADAERLRLERRLTREMEPDRGYVDAARSGSNPHLERECFFCLESDTNAYMPCCQRRVHKACIQTWHAMGQDKTGKHELRAPRMDGGWKPVVMERLHTCPWCNAEMLSARVWRV